MELEEINLKIAEFIRKNRQKRKFSHRDMERETQINRGGISRLEGSSGFNVNFTLKTLNKILLAFDKDFLDLFHYVYEKEKKKTKD